MHGVVFGVALDSLDRFRRRFQHYSIELDIGLVASAWRGFQNSSRARGVCMKLSARTFWHGTRDAVAWPFVGEAPGSYAEVLHAAIVEFAEVDGMSPVIVVGTKRFIMYALDHSCVFFCALMNLYLVDDMISAFCREAPEY